MDRVQKLKFLLWTLVGLGAAVAAARFYFSLGATTNLGDANGGGFYIPAWTEVAITLGIIAVAVLAFLFILEHFRVWEERRPVDPLAAPKASPEFDKVSTTWLDMSAGGARTVYSLAAVVAAAVGFGLLTANAAYRQGINPAPVHQARGGEVLWIDGNLDGVGVAFNHEEHQKRLGDKDSCVLCHHMNLPGSRNSACSSCHRDMYRATNAFPHAWHSSPQGANLACYECHTPGLARSAQTAVRCDHCHKDLVPPNSLIQVKSNIAPSYVEAMHRTCIGCHQTTECGSCHKTHLNEIQRRGLLLRDGALPSGSPILPPPGN